VVRRIRRLVLVVGLEKFVAQAATVALAARAWSIIGTYDESAIRDNEFGNICSRNISDR
jgi:hypothetical protein